MKVGDLLENTLSFLRDRRRAYGLLFREDTAQGRLVLKDLMDFSHFLEGPARPTNEETWRLIGRQDVIRRIMQHTSLNVPQLMSLYNNGTIPIMEQSDTGDDYDR